MTPSNPVVRTRSQHPLSRRDIDPDALKVLYRLARRGHVAYLVGGSVRDLLLGRRPKDFDVSTDARPRQLKSIFPNCFLIGRRFRLAHIRFGEKIIETSTFRRQPETDGDPEDPETSLLQQDDNTFGTPEEDARRRDFTINGLFYDAEKSAVIDYVGGLDDVCSGVVRCIGDPDIRFREDPVRMIRAVRFAARLGFRIEPETRAALGRHSAEITKAAPPRLVEEIQRLFAFGSAEPAFRLLHETGLLAILLAEIDDHLEEHGPDARLYRLLRALDAGGTILDETTPALRFAALFADYIDTHPPAPEEKDRKRPDLAQHISALLQPIQERLKLPRRIVDRMVRILAAQPRFEPGARRRRGRKRFVRQGSFPESLAFRELVLDADGASEEERAEFDTWLQLYRDEGPAAGSEEEEEDDDAETTAGNGNTGRSSRARGRSRGGRRRKRGGRSRSRTSSGDASDRTSQDQDQNQDQDQPRDPEQKENATPAPDETGDASGPGDGSSGSSSRKKRRRRRKKTTGDATAAGADSRDAASKNDDAAPSTKRRSRKSASGSSTERNAAAVSHDAIDTSRPVTAMSFYGSAPDPSGPETEESDNGRSAKGTRRGRSSRKGRDSTAGRDGPEADKPHKPAPDETAPSWMEEI